MKINIRSFVSVPGLAVLAAAAFAVTSCQTTREAGERISNLPYESPASSQGQAPYGGYLGRSDIAMEPPVTAAPERPGLWARAGASGGAQAWLDARSTGAGGPSLGRRTGFFTTTRKARKRWRVRADSPGDGRGPRQQLLTHS